MPAPRLNAAGQPVNEAGERICGAETRHCACGPRPGRGSRDGLGHHQRMHERAGPANTRRGACTHEGCTCAGFDPYPCEVAVGLFPNGRCQRHGGPTLTGVAAPGWRGRGLSRVLPERLLDHYHEALRDPDLLSLRQEIALQRALLNDVLARLAGNQHVPGAAFEAVQALGRAWRTFEAAYRAGRPERLGQALTGLGEAVRGVAGAMEPEMADADLRAEVRATTGALERLARSENSRLAELHNMITAERALALQHASVQALLDVLEANVPDAQVRAKIRREAAGKLAELAGRPASPGGGWQPAGDGDAGDGGG